jgi:hypothetical protein
MFHFEYSLELGGDHRAKADRGDIPGREARVTPRRETTMKAAQMHTAARRRARPGRSSLWSGLACDRWPRESFGWAATSQLGKIRHVVVA